MEIKLLEDVKLVYWMETIQAKVEIDGDEIQFRYSENSKGSEFWVFDGHNWVEPSSEYEWNLQEVCSCLEINKDSKSGELFEYIEED
jgi:hypothetical protein